jgi:hypothetical protein
LGQLSAAPRAVGSDVGSNPGGGGATGGSAGGGSGVTYATNSTQAPINNAQIGQIDSEIGRLGTQESIARGNLDRSYNANRDSPQNGLNSAEGQYNTTLARTQQDNVDAKGQIDQGVRSGLSGLQRLLGAAGAGNSSAAHVLAPYAAGLAGNTQRQAVNKAYGRNTEDLNTGIADTRQQYKEKFGQLDTDKANKLNSLLAGLADTRAQLLASRQAAGGGDQSAQIRALHNQIDQYGNQSVFDPGQVAYHAPNLQDYSFDPTAAAQTGDPNQAGIASNIGSYYNLLQGNKDKKTILGA